MDALQTTGAHFINEECKQLDLLNSLRFWLDPSHRLPVNAGGVGQHRLYKIVVRSSSVSSMEELQCTKIPVRVLQPFLEEARNTASVLMMEWMASIGIALDDSKLKAPPAKPRPFLYEDYMDNPTFNLEAEVALYVAVLKDMVSRMNEISKLAEVLSSVKSSIELLERRTKAAKEKDDKEMEELGMKKCFTTLELKLEHGLEVSEEEVNARLEKIVQDEDYEQVANLFGGFRSYALHSVEHARIALTAAERILKKSIDLRVFRSYTMCISSLCERLPEKDVIALLDEKIAMPPGNNKVMEMLEKPLWSRCALATLLMAGLRQWIQSGQEEKTNNGEDGVIGLFRSLPEFVRVYLVNGSPCVFIRANIDRSGFSKAATDTPRRLLWLVDVNCLPLYALIEQVSLCNGNKWKNVMAELLKIDNIGRVVSQASSIYDFNHALLKSLVNLEDELLSMEQLEVLLKEMHRLEERKDEEEQRKFVDFVLSYESAEDLGGLWSRLEGISAKYKPAAPTKQKKNEKEKKEEVWPMENEDIVTGSTQRSEHLNEEEEDVEEESTEMSAQPSGSGNSENRDGRKWKGNEEKKRNEKEQQGRNEWKKEKQRKNKNKKKREKKEEQKRKREEEEEKKKEEQKRKKEEEEEKKKEEQKRKKEEEEEKRKEEQMKREEEKKRRQEDKKNVQKEVEGRTTETNKENEKVEQVDGEGQKKEVEVYREEKKTELVEEKKKEEDGVEGVKEEDKMKKLFLDEQIGSIDNHTVNE